ncbi:MAG: hypothetical protein ACSLEX_02470 [Minisyncoccota bacterium]
MRTSLLMLIVLCVFLSGCTTTMGTQSGFSVQPKESIARQEPWHTMVITGNVSILDGVDVAYVSLPDPLPSYWRDEVVDTKRTYIKTFEDGKKLRKPIEKLVFRALFYQNERLVGMADAIINPALTGFFILLPADMKPAKQNMVIVSMDTSWMMTTMGEKITVPITKSLPSGFFQQHPSPLTQVVRMERKDPSGKLFFDELESLFNQRLRIGSMVYSGRPDTLLVLRNFTSAEHPVDRLVSCGTAPVTPGLVTITLALAAIQNVRTVTSHDCYH